MVLLVLGGSDLGGPGLFVCFQSAPGSLLGTNKLQTTQDPRDQLHLLRLKEETDSVFFSACFMLHKT